MSGPDKKLSLLLSGGVDNRTFSELVSPVITQGEAPKLVKSTNTRLSVRPGTCVRAPLASTVLSLGVAQKRWGITPAQSGKAVAMAAAAGSPYFFSGYSPGTGSDSLSQQYSTYFPARLTGSYALDDINSTVPVSIGYDALTGIMWRAYERVSSLGTPNTIEVVVSAWTLDGILLGSPRTITTFATVAIPWTGITIHGASGPRVWYMGPLGISYRSLAISGRNITAGAEQVVALPGGASGVDVVSDGSSNFAYLAHSTVGTAANGTLRRVDVTSNTTTHSATIVGALAGNGYACVYLGTIAGNVRVGVGFSRATGAKTTIAYYDSTLTTVGAAFEVDGLGFITMGHTESSPALSACYLNIWITAYGGDFDASPATISGTTGYIGTTGYEVRLDLWGSAFEIDRRPWMMVQSHCLQYSSGTDQRPMLLLGRSYGNTKWLYGEANYVDDPGITVVMTGRQATDAHFARFGVVRGIATPALTQPINIFASRSAIMVNGKIYAAYRRLPQSYTAPQSSTARMVVIDTSPHQPPTAQDKDGVALMAGAMPIQMDGSAGYEIGSPMHAPRIAYSNGGGFALAAGVYKFAAVFRWTDAAGVQHRSRPSNLIVKTFDGLMQARMYVSAPDGAASRAFGRVYVQFYMSEKNGTTLHLHAETGGNSTTTTVIFDVTSYPDGARPQLYSTQSAGEELGPQPPPPLRDITIVGARAWGVDAEYPSRLVFSKLRIAGYGYEFNPALEVNLPSGAGECMAVRGFGGVTFALCQLGVWQIVGDGPNNNVSGGEFSPPIKVSDIGCSNTASVVVCPAGVLWQNRDRFVMLSAAGVEYMPDFNCTYDVSHAITLDRYNEVLFLSNAVAEVRVYNHAVKRWTTWDSQAMPEAATLAAALPWNPDRILTYNEASGTLRALDAGTVSTAASMTWETDWFLLGGDFQDHCIVRDIVLNGTIVGPHSVTIEVYVDYETSVSTSHTWSAVELDAIDIGGRYTVRLEPAKQNCRAMKIKVYDTVAPAEVVRDGMAPRSLTIVWAAENMLYEEVFVQGSRA
jgi:hypothetical protein